jgi:hypothetical protein
MYVAKVIAIYEFIVETSIITISRIIRKVMGRTVALGWIREGRGEFVSLMNPRCNLVG